MDRLVTATILRPDGSPWANAPVHFTLAPGSYTSEAQYPSAAVRGITDADGGLGRMVDGEWVEGVLLWANEEGEEESAWTCRHPDFSTFTFTLPPGDGSAIDLYVLRLAGAINRDWTVESVTAFILAHPDLRGAAATIEIGDVTTGAPGSAAQVANSGSSGAAVLDIVIPRGDPGLDGEDGEDADIAAAEAATSAANTAAASATSAATSATTAATSATNAAAAANAAATAADTAADGADTAAGSATTAAASANTAATSATNAAGAANTAASTANTAATAADDAADAATAAASAANTAATTAGDAADDATAAASAANTAATSATSAAASATSAAADAVAAATVTVNAQVGTTYTLVLSDVAKLVTLDNAAAITLTIPPNSSVAWPVGKSVILQQIGAGQVTVLEGSGVTLRTKGPKLNGQYAAATLLKTATNVWTLIGDVTT